ncbi:APC family permease [Streptomyces sp. NPDC002623]
MDGSTSRSTTTPERSADTESADAPRLEGNLGTAGLVLTALAFNAPLAMMAAFIPLMIGMGIGAGTPLVYAAVAGLMLLFATGVVTMARHMDKPGAFYTYVTAGIGRVAGLGAGFVALFCYIVIAAGSFVLSGLMTSELVHALHGPGVPWWAWSIVSWSICSALSLFNIDISTRVLGVCLVIEVVIVSVWDVAVFADGGPQGLGLDFTAQLGTGSMGFALLWGVACLMGFESIQVFRAETRDPDRTVPRATYLTVIVLAGFYMVGSWAYLAAFGTDAAVATALNPTTSFLGSLEQYTSVVMRDLANILLVSSGIAALLAMLNISSRYGFSLARDRVLPASLARVHPRHHAPTRAAAMVSGVVFVLMLVPAVLRLDPVTVYASMIGLGNWGVLGLLVATSLSVVLYFRRNPGLVSSRWKTVVAPLLAMIGLLVVFYQATVNRDTLMGGNMTVATAAIGVVVALALGGLLYARWLRTHRPEVYARIGDQHIGEGPAPVPSTAGDTADVR